ncbi:YesL family protein [Bifidobacterium tibiigranuli]|uniref:YesL family protein n=1 Tax=Bifidobacterium tibiigranuli TaxID=2172043 RepID=UPI0026EF6243|nr:YesL family protein [Bifidobacterium tibiigranuli]MCI1649052.1 YesL family protein [Bifidobacterium tibiigranuli]MCI2186287.1 YesL family protein [Bifidobacterium tibiigranuli]MCI2203887.1 YesL family protein [Bifidobacterium tibiigranuli]
MKFLSPDSRFMQGVSDAADAVWINILMLLTSIPIITIGAALVAGNSAARRTIEGEGHATANYFAAFRSNFMRSTLLWLVFGPTLALLAYAWVVLQITPLLIPKFALSILWIIGFEWVWALQARFDNSFGRTLANAFILGISHIVLTATVIAIDAVFLALLVASWFYMPQGLFLLLVFGYGTLIMLHIPILDRCLNRYVASQGSEAN